MRALVTGSCGFVGGHLVRHLVAAGDQVLGTLLNDPPPGHSTEGVKFDRVTLDVSDADAVRRVVAGFKPEVIYHLAGIAFVPEAEENFDRVLRVNVGATNNLCRAAHLAFDSSLPRTKVLLVSSAEVYGRITPEQLPLTEETTLSPVQNYSLSKLMAEEVGKRYARAGNIEVVIARPFNHIGPGQDPRFVASSFARQLAQIERGAADPVLRVGNLEARRDFSDVRDIVRGYRLAVQKGTGIYNFGSGRAIPVRTILEELIRSSTAKVTVEQDPARMRAAEVPELFGSISKVSRELGWNPQIPLRQTLTDLLEFWRAEGR